MGVPLVIIHLNRIFPSKPSSYWGTSMTMETPKSIINFLGMNIHHMSPGFSRDHECARSIFSEEHLYASNRSAKIPVLGGLRLQVRRCKSEECGNECFK